MKRSLLVAAASTVIVATIAIPAFAEGNGNASSAMMKHPKTTVDTACMAAAVTARDTAISTALTAVATAVQTRGQALAAAWGNTDPKARQAAMKAANAAFAGTWKTFGSAKNAAWDQYKTAAKACHGTSTDSANTTSGSM